MNVVPPELLSRWSGMPTGQVMGQTHYQPQQYYGPDQYYTRPDPNGGPQNMQAASMMESVIPTSWNLRNRALQEVERMGRTPIGGMVASRTADSFLDTLLPNLQKTRANLAARGLVNSGELDRFRTNTYQQLLKGLGGAVGAGYQANQDQRSSFLSMLDSMYGNDNKMLAATRNYVDPRSFQQATTAENQMARANTQRFFDLGTDLAAGAWTAGMGGAAPSIVRNTTGGQLGSMLRSGYDQLSG